MYSKSAMLLSCVMMGALASAQDYRVKTPTPNREYDNPPLTKVKEIIPNGMIRFDYEGGYVYAINKRNADRKAKRLGYIK